MEKRIQEKFGYMPKNIKVVSYFTFLHNFCYRPLLSHKVKSKGLHWDIPPQYTRTFRRDNKNYYLSKGQRLYHNRLSKLLEVENILDEVNARLEKYYDCLYIDEVQDFGGHDFDFLKSISKANLTMLFVGDFFQHTFDTSRDSNTNATLHDDYDRYQAEFKKMGLVPDAQSLSKTFRCSPTVCDFIREKLKIEIHSHKTEPSTVEVISDTSTAATIFHNSEIVKIFYQEHYKYACHSRNWGECKGEDAFVDICVVLNKGTFKKYSSNKLHELSPRTKNKLYVACSRAGNHLYFVDESLLKCFKR